MSAITSLLGLVIGLAFVLWLAARDGAKRNEQLSQSKREKDELNNQLEISHEQKSISENAPFDRDAALRTLRSMSERHRTNR